MLMSLPGRNLCISHVYQWLHFEESVSVVISLVSLVVVVYYVDILTEFLVSFQGLC